MLAAAFAPTPAQRLLHSHDLWATVNVCSPKDQPNTIGIRGSMPSDGHAKDVMYMRFTVQYQEPATKKWIDLGHEADSGFLKVGSAGFARQAGRSFQFAQTTGKPRYILRGDIIFQWRRGATVLETATASTTAGHKSLAGADPTGYSAATCTLT
jgi:hypothetical protein